MRDPDWVSFQNASSSLSATPFAPLQVVGVLLKESNDLVLQCDQVGSAANPGFNRRIVFNGPCSVAPQSYGRCTESLRVTAAWDTGTPNPGDSWGVKPGQFALTKSGVGDFIVDGVVDSSSKRMFGRWLGINSVIGKCGTSAISADTSGTMNLWTGPAGSEAVVSGWTASVFCRGFGRGSGDWMAAQIIDGQWYGLSFGGKAKVIGGTTAASLSSLGTVSCNVGYANDGLSPGSTVNVTDEDGAFGTYPIASGKKFKAIYNSANDTYYFLWIAC
jgi:hypothetical protein